MFIKMLDEIKVIQNAPKKTFSYTKHTPPPAPLPTPQMGIVLLLWPPSELSGFERYKIMKQNFLRKQKTSTQKGLTNFNNSFQVNIIPCKNVLILLEYCFNIGGTSSSNATFSLTIQGFLVVPKLRSFT
jgi:hypothetical protein